MKEVVLLLLTFMQGYVWATPIFDDAWIAAEHLGGEATYVSPNPTALAYRNPITNLPEDKKDLFFLGDRLFDKKFSDDLTRPDYGLGPAYNHLSCVGCHVQDGRGALPAVLAQNQWTKLGSGAQVFLRMSLEEAQPKAPSADNNFGAPTPVPGFGDQLFHLGSFGLRDDAPGTGLAEVWMKYEFSEFNFPDGEKVKLRKPVFSVRNPYDLTADGHSRLFAPDVRFGARMTPQMTGLGLIEAIAEAAILQLSQRDLSAWGIHGRPNQVLDRVKKMKGDPVPVSLGRFGLKANTPTIYQQSLGALNGDMGVTNLAFPNESIFGSSLFEAFKSKWKPGIEASDEISLALVFYAQTLAVPSRRNLSDGDVIRGARLFKESGCANCHHPSFRTGPHEISALSGQLIYPFSDFLLHDMGEGLADGRSDFAASGRDWKTRPLWGLGLTQVVNPRAGYLHDGRAKTLVEAIVWHAGEAEKSKEYFVHLAKVDREAVIKFLQSL